MGVAALSLFATQRLFDLRLPTGKPGKDGSEAIQAYCANPPPDTVLLVTAQDWSKSHAGKWSEAIARTGHVVPVWPVKPHELLDWLGKRLHQRGLAASPAAVRDARRTRRRQPARRRAGGRQTRPAVAAARRLDEDAMARFVADSARFDVFKLVESALAGDALRASRMLRGLRAEGEQVPGLLPILAMEILRLGQLARVAADGGNVMTAMREARVWESKQALYRRAIDRHPAARWEVFVGEAGRIDRIAKGRGTGDAWLSLERLLVAMAEPKARRLLVS